MFEQGEKPVLTIAVLSCYVLQINTLNI